MRPLQRSVILLLAALALTGGVAVAAPDDEARSSGPLACEEHFDEVREALAYAEVSYVCMYSEAVPPEAWPPGAQAPLGGHPEIQVIR